MAHVRRGQKGLRGLSLRAVINKKKISYLAFLIKKSVTRFFIRQKSVTRFFILQKSVTRFFT